MVVMVQALLMTHVVMGSGGDGSGDGSGGGCGGGYGGSSDGWLVLPLVRARLLQWLLLLPLLHCRCTTLMPEDPDFWVRRLPLPAT